MKKKKQYWGLGEYFNNHYFLCSCSYTNSASSGLFARLKHSFGDFSSFQVHVGEYVLIIRQGLRGWTR